MRTITERRTTISLSPPSTSRLRMRPRDPAGSSRTPLDGGWWPRSTDPVAELPGLILALQAGPQAHGPADDHGRITHVMLRVADWDSRPRRLRVDGPADTRMVRLSWFDTLPTGLLTALYADGHRVDLLTVPPYTSHAAARSALELAAHDTNHLPAPKLLAALLTPITPNSPAATTGPEVTSPDPSEPQDTWETEGGRLREHLAAP
ncbi:DUF5994 family protein [Actinomadura viridis]|uniref:DUF5994 family protein n=1 Tax=Actinomadura viridis TaxID=58110 RepID=UPI0036C8ACE9